MNYELVHARTDLHDLAEEFAASLSKDGRNHFLTFEYEEGFKDGVTSEGKPPDRVQNRQSVSDLRYALGFVEGRIDRSRRKRKQVYSRGGK